MGRVADCEVIQDMHKKANKAAGDSRNHLTSKHTELSDGIAKPTSVFESILASNTLSDEEKGANRIAQEGLVVLVAGGETTARVLTAATFHILAASEA